MRSRGVSLRVRAHIRLQEQTRHKRPPPRLCAQRLASSVIPLAARKVGFPVDRSSEPPTVHQWPSSSGTDRSV